MIKVRHMSNDRTVAERESLFNEICSSLPDYYVLIKTCNRVLLIEDTSPDTLQKDQKVLELISELSEIATGLKSSIIGENQVLHQVKKAYTDAINEKHISKTLHFIFQNSLRISKIVRTETDISKGASSHGHAAMQIINEYFKDNRNAFIALVGVHHMNEMIISHLIKRGFSNIALYNRSLDKAYDASAKFNITAKTLECINQDVTDINCILTATSAQDYIFSSSIFDTGRRMLVIDLAVPLDIEPSVKDIESVTYYSSEDIESIVKNSVCARYEEADKALYIIGKEIKKMED